MAWQRSPFRRFVRDERGVASIEFALVAPVLLLLVFGIVCFGYAITISSALQQLAAEAARASVQGLTRAEREAIAADVLATRAETFPLLQPDRITETLSYTETPFPGLRLALRYDLSDSIVGLADGFFPFDLTTVTRAAYIAY